MRRRTLLQSSAFFAISTLSATAFSGCRSNSSDATSPLRVGLVPWIGWSSAHIAEVKGFYQEEGVQVQQTVFQTVTEVNTALLAKQVDLAWLVAVDLLVLHAQAPDLKFIMACDYSGEVDAILGRNITAPNDLKGKKLAREDIPYIIVFVGRYLESIGLTEKDVQILSIPVPDGTAAFVAGKVDAVSSYEPFIGKALKERAGAKVLFTAKGTNIISNGLAGYAQGLQTHRNDVLAYMRAINKAMQFAQDHPAEANEIVAKWVGITAAEVGEQMRQIKLLDIEANKAIAFNPNNPLNVVNSIDSGTKFLVAAGKVTQPVEGQTLVDPSFVQAL